MHDALISAFSFVNIYQILADPQAHMHRLDLSAPPDNAPRSLGGEKVTSLQARAYPVARPLITAVVRDAISAPLSNQTIFDLTGSSRLTLSFCTSAALRAPPDVLKWQAGRPARLAVSALTGNSAHDRYPSRALARVIDRCEDDPTLTLHAYPVRRSEPLLVRRFTETVG
ncbi:hypothetical protein H4582DRAFT_2081449 [Lactarius indigo]|nr:hypothetical protein H4582DRAFT_2081449 [Lactarius indigo]